MEITPYAKIGIWTKYFSQILGANWDFFSSYRTRTRTGSHSRFFPRRDYFLHGDGDMVTWTKSFLQSFGETAIFLIVEEGNGDGVPSQNFPFSSISNMHQLQKSSYGQEYTCVHTVECMFMYIKVYSPVW